VTHELNVFIKVGLLRSPVLSFIYLFIMKFVQLGTQLKTRCEKRKYTKIHKVHYEVHKNHIIKSTSDSQNSEI